MNLTETTYLRRADGCQRQLNHFARADALLAEAGDLIKAGRHDASTGAARTCELILTLLQGVRSPVQRLIKVSGRAL